MRCLQQPSLTNRTGSRHSEAIMQEQGTGEAFAPISETREPKKITVLVVDDHPIMRIGIAAIIQARRT
jgi:hypothetical protein